MTAYSPHYRTSLTSLPTQLVHPERPRAMAKPRSRPRQLLEQAGCPHDRRRSHDVHGPGLLVVDRTAIGDGDVVPVVVLVPVDGPTVPRSHVAAKSALQRRRT